MAHPSLRLNVVPCGRGAWPGGMGVWRPRQPRPAPDEVLHWAGGMKPWDVVRNRHYDHLVAPYAPGDRCAGLPLKKSVNKLYGGLT